MSLRFYSIVVDSADPQKLSQWWAEALRWKVTFADEDGGEYDVAAGLDADGKELEPILTFVPVPEAKTIKNRLHIDLAPDDRDGEVDRLLGLGATRAEIGQGPDETWVVLADPEGNEFCVLSSR